MVYQDVIHHPENFDFRIASLGACTVDSPIVRRAFVDDEERISFSGSEREIRALLSTGAPYPAFEKAGPRRRLFHDPAWSRAAIVTCGGLCPGLNDVIKGLVNTLHFVYGVRNIYGIPYGYRGLVPRYHHAPLLLTPELVDTIHQDGGTILGSSRGAQEPSELVDTLQRLSINMLFTIGGDGTLKGARAIAEEIARRKMPISVVGIPKTIDNDLSFVGRTFGFETAVYATTEIVTSAHNEAKGAYNGIGLVKLMGRDSGFIAAYASLANTVVNICLIPELEFELEGEEGLLRALERRFDMGKGHAVIVVAEGAGQHLFRGETGRDASGNQLKHDIGEFLRDRISAHFQSRGREVSVKYFDPSYYIRSVAARGADSIFCHLLAENAVHAALAGKTNVVIGHWSNHYTHVPIPLATMQRQKVDPDGPIWAAVLSATRQDDYFRPR